MKRLIQFTLCSVALLASIAFVGCTDEIVLDPPTTGGTDGDGVVFNFVVDELNVATEDKGSSVGTKATTAVEPSTDIKNMWVVQFNASNTIISKEYFAEFTTTGCVNLEDGVSDIAFIANTFDEDLIGDVDDIDDITTDKTLTKDSEENEYFILCGAIEGYDPKQGATVTLRRNIARVNITVTDGVNDGKPTDEKLELKSIKIYNVPTHSRCYIDHTATDLYSIGSADEATTYTLTGTELTAAAGSNGATIYIPVNELGVQDGTNGSEENKNSKDKVKNAPEFATYAVVEFMNGFYAHSYTFYLGADMVTDYNIKANHAYNYTFNIDEEGNNLIDPRVDKYIAYVPMINQADLDRWKAKNAENSDALNGLITDHFNFKYTVGQVYGTNLMPTREVIEQAKPIDGYATVGVPSYSIRFDWGEYFYDVREDVLLKLLTITMMFVLMVMLQWIMSMMQPVMMIGAFQISVSFF